MNKAFVALFFLVLLFSACQSQSTDYRQVRAVSGGGQPSETPPEPEAVTQPSSDSPTLSPLKEQLRQYLQNPPTSKVTYHLQTQIQDQDQTHTISGTQTVAIRGKDLSMKTTLEDSQSTTANYVLNGVYYACQMESSQWTCYELPKPKNDPTPQIQQAIQDDLEKMDVTDAGQKTFLGVKARCFGLGFQDPQTQESGQTTYCYDEKGALLYSHTQTSTFENTLEATAYHPPTQADFQLPAKAQSLPEEPASS